MPAEPTRRNCNGQLWTKCENSFWTEFVPFSDLHARGSAYAATSAGDRRGSRKEKLVTDRREEPQLPIPRIAEYAAMMDACPTCRALDGWRVPYAELRAHPKMYA